MKKFEIYIKMDKRVIALGDTEIEKHKFHCHNSSISIVDVYIDKTLTSNNISFDKKGFK